MRYDVTLPGSVLRFSIEARDDRDAIGTALRIAREQHHDVKVHAGEDGRLVADTTDDRAVPVAARAPAGARGGPELASIQPIILNGLTHFVDAQGVHALDCSGCALEAEKG
jgi:hypothetical protein